MITLEIFIGTLLRSIEIAKKYHLEGWNHNWVIHKSLDSYYEKAGEIVDNIYEETAAIIDLNDLQSTYDKNDFTDPLDFLRTINNFILDNRDKVYNETVNSNIFSHLDELMSLISQTIYKIKNISEALESQMEDDKNLKRAQKEYLSNDLTYNGNPIRQWFEDHAQNLSKQMEKALNKDYRCVSKVISGLFFSNLYKDFIFVMESYRQGFYVLGRTKMIDVFQPESVNNIKFFKCANKEALIKMVQDIDKTMKPIYVNLREELVNESTKRKYLSTDKEFIEQWDKWSFNDREKFIKTMEKYDKERFTFIKTKVPNIYVNLIANNIEAMPDSVQNTLFAYYQFSV